MFPAQVIFTLLALCFVALAGPTWEREQPPFIEDTAPLIVALDLSVTMDAIDVQPTRLERAKQKVHDLLALRTGARTGLLAYAGTGHMVLPLTSDREILEVYLGSLSTGLMPVEGKDAGQALARAAGMLAHEQVPGTILFVTDGIGPQYFPALAEYGRGKKHQISLLALGTTKGGPIRIGENTFLTNAAGARVIARLDNDNLEVLSAQAGVSVVRATVDDSDVRRLNDSIQSHMALVQSEDENLRWKDFGYYLCWPIGVLVLLWFRRGFLVQWCVALLLVTGSSGPVAAQTSAFRFLDLWLTPDQQGRFYFEKGDYLVAAERFQDPLWKGVAWYSAENYGEAITWFAQVDGAVGHFNLGNAYARAEQFEEAAKSYDQALSLEPDYPDARANLELMRAILKKIAEEKPTMGDETGSTLGADEVKLDKDLPEEQLGKQMQPVDLGQMSDEQINEMWMRRLDTTPAEFLRSKFAVQAAAEGQR